MTENELLEKENELLKRENELFRQQNLRNELNGKVNAGGSLEDVFEFKTYYNKSRQFKIDYPSFLTMQPASQNDDGRVFVSDGGDVKLWVYSSYNISQSIPSLFGEELNNENLSITYKVKKSNWYVVSGINNVTNNEFYKKVYYSGQSGDQLRTMYVEYSQSRHQDFDIIIPRMVQTFKDI